MPSSVDGSSPLARGTPLAAGLAAGQPRFIPARAGNTRPCGRWSRRSPVHPRSRGEHGCPYHGIACMTGSSPLARGTHPAGARADFRRRFIPARAGNTAVALPEGQEITVHPRSRGEHAGRVLPAERAGGSSPLARGTPPSPGQGGRCDRFIPARAGNTPAVRCGIVLRSVHPRSRGEHVGRLHHLHAQARFIPARAGNTMEPGPAPGSAPVHPRSRGEHARWPAR